MNKWVVNGLIPEGHIVLLLGTPHSMKSWLIEQIAICCSTGQPLFGEEGYKTQVSSVIIVDEDTPTDTLTTRLSRLKSGIDATTKEPITPLSMTGFSLSNEPSMQMLLALIAQKEGKVLVILDSLSSMSGAWDLNKSRDANRIFDQIKRLKSAGATVIVAHHMSLKKESSFEDFDFTSKALGSTLLVAFCDTAIGCWRIPPDVPTRSVIATKPRRTALKVTKPFGIELIEDKSLTWAKIEFCGELPVEPSDQAVRIFPVFYNDRRELTVSQVVEALSKDLSESDVRNALHELEKNKCLARGQAKGARGNRYIYSLSPDMFPPETKVGQDPEDYMILDTYQARLLERCKE